MMAEDLSIFFNVNEFAELASWTPPGGGSTQTASILFDVVDEGLDLETLNMTARVMRAQFPANKFIGLDAGHSLTINGAGYRVLSVDLIGDGSIVEARLGTY